MAPSPLRSKTKKHTRSSSFPSRPHPVVPQFDEHLSVIKASEAAPSSLSSLTNKMSSIESLYDCVDDLLQLPHVQQAMSQECQEKWVDDLLDGYLRVLDACAITKDILVNEEQNLQNLLSAIRRRRDTDDISGYLTSRRKAEKIIHKSLKALRSIKNKENVVILENHETVAVVSMLKEVESVTLAMFESLLSYFLATNTQSRQGSWSMISKLLQSKTTLSEAETNEFEKVIVLMHEVVSHKSGKVEEVQSQLGEMESSIQVLEQELECLFRRLIKTRVSILNIFNH